MLTYLDIDGPGAVGKHYDLLSAIVRIICAVIISRGSQNQQTIELGHRFLSENRLSILAVLKKSAGLGSLVGASAHSVDGLAECYMLLISITGFIDVNLSPPTEENVTNIQQFEDQTAQKKQSAKAFTAFT